MKTLSPLQDGESAIESAPQVLLDNGNHCIPQHYLNYQHTLESVEKLILDIQYSAQYPIFVCEDNSGIYIQVGVIGFDNYPSSIKHKNQQAYKIVYGRKWRVEPTLPTSEIIQTVFLALKKAREHEIRELFRIHHDKGFSTPFNNHHDLPLMAINTEALLQVDKQHNSAQLITNGLHTIRYDGASFKLSHLESRVLNNVNSTKNKAQNTQWLLDIEVVKSSGSFLPELEATSFTLLLQELNFNQLCFSLMQKCIELSDRHVDENFSFREYHRFSWHNQVTSISKLSIKTRNIHQAESNQALKQAFTQNNYDTDLSRVPKLNNSPLAKRLKRSLQPFGDLEGITPMWST